MTDSCILLEAFKQIIEPLSGSASEPPVDLLTASQNLVRKERAPVGGAVKPPTVAPLFLTASEVRMDGSRVRVNSEHLVVLGELATVMGEVKELVEGGAREVTVIGNHRFILPHCRLVDVKCFQHPTTKQLYYDFFFENLTPHENLTALTISLVPGV